MRETVNCLLLVCLLSIPGDVFGQEKFYPEYAPNSISQMVRNQHSLDERNFSHVGQPYVNFDLHTQDSKSYNNKSLEGKVTLLFFWSDFDLAKLKDIYMAYHKRRDFQLVFVTFDTVGLKNTMVGNGLQAPYIYVGFMDNKLSEMNFANGFPSFVLIDKKSIVKQVDITWRMDNDEANIATLKANIATLL